jgi:hypothetical protein
VNSFEDELRSALRREQPPAGFRPRVLARARVLAAPRRMAWIAAGIAACLLLSAGGFEYRLYEGRKAKQELLMALEIAGNKLNIAQKKVSDLSRRTIHD